MGRGYILLRFIFKGDGRLSAPGVLLTLTPFVLLTAATFAAAWFANALELPGAAVGLLEHWGFLSYVAVTPILLLLVALILRESLNVVANLDQYSTTKSLPPKTRVVRQKFLRSLQLHSNTKYVLYLLALVGLLCSIVNILQTITPEPVFGNDVFDSSKHLPCFIFAKLYIALSWTLVYPICGFILFHAAFLVPYLARTMATEQAVRVDVFDRDKCGGLADFGRLNYLAMLAYLPIFIFFLCLYHTHTNPMYLSVIIPLFGLSVFFIAQSVFGVYHIHRVISARKDELLSRLSTVLDKNLTGALERGAFPSELIAVQRHIERLQTFPYSTGVSRMVNFLRYFPSVIGFAKLFWGV